MSEFKFINEDPPPKLDKQAKKEQSELDKFKSEFVSKANWHIIKLSIGLLWILPFVLFALYFIWIWNNIAYPRFVFITPDGLKFLDELLEGVTSFVIGVISATFFKNKLSRMTKSND
ncbi:MAG: hypothetical protein Kapaf2KO_22620 [Candidatus Kapaibacteriales bacterium]